jgi:integrase
VRISNRKKVVSLEQRAKITKRMIDALSPGETIWDGALTGFGARRQTRDATFILKCSVRGRQRFFTIGRHGAFTCETARLEAHRLLGLVASGVDPAMLRMSAKKSKITVADLCEDYLKSGRLDKPDKRESSWYTDESNIRRHIIPLLGKIGADDLDSDKVATFVDQVSSGATKVDERLGHRRRAIVRGGKGTASRVLSVLAAIYTFGIKHHRVAVNPAKGVKAAKGNAPGRFLTSEEWSRLGLAMSSRASKSRTFVDAIGLLALTGCRRSEITNLKWTEVDLHRGFLRLGQSKVGPRAVPLGDAAINLLKSLSRTNSLWVFPASRGAGPIVGIQKVWSEIRREAGLETVRLHDLRHSFASEAITTGASLYLTGAILGHRQSSTTERYAHLQSDHVRRTASEVSQHISSALGYASVIRDS